MGYRSDLKIIFYATEDENYPAVKLWVDENVSKEFEYKEDKVDHPYKDETMRVIVYDIHDAKWYPDFDDVEAMNAALDKFEEVFGGEGTLVPGAMEFIRLGEDDDDIERRITNGALGLIGVRREIVWY